MYIFVGSGEGGGSVCSATHLLILLSGLRHVALIELSLLHCVYYRNDCLIADDDQEEEHDEDEEDDDDIQSK